MKRYTKEEMEGLRGAVNLTLDCVDNTAAKEPTAADRMLYRGFMMRKFFKRSRDTKRDTPEIRLALHLAAEAIRADIARRYTPEDVRKAARAKGVSIQC